MAAGATTYTVQAGDTLFAIALKYNLTLDQLLPPLTLNTPADNSTTNKTFVTVTGTIVLPVASVAVTVNGGTPTVVNVKPARTGE